ncbi:MAG: hypothetical protein JXQ87_16015 [Bacteroidia bacterium]
MGSKIKHITIRILAVLLVFALANFIYSKTLWFSDVDQYSDTLENLWPHQDISDIIYFGESSNFYQEHPDTPKVRISDHLNRMIPELVIEEVDNAGLWASNYLHIMRHIPKDSKVKAIVVTMNLRSFGPTWQYDKNSNYLKQADELIKPRPKLLNRFMIALKAFDYIEPKQLVEKKNEAWEQNLHFEFDLKYKSLFEWNKAMANGGHLRPDGGWDMERINLSCHYIKNFAFKIDVEHNPRIHDFDKIVAYAKERGWKLYFHLLSDNLEEADELVGNGLTNIMYCNFELLVKRYHKPENDVEVINNAATVPNSEFRDRSFPTEHYSNDGKRLCAKTLAQKIKQDLSFFE